MNTQQTANILHYWKLVEELTPPEVKTDLALGYVKSIQKEVLQDHDIPWLNKERFPKHVNTDDAVWAYTVYLGGIKREEIMLEIKRFFAKDNKIKLNNVSGFTSLVAFKVDITGTPLPGTLEIPDYFLALSRLSLGGVQSLVGLEEQYELLDKLKDVYANFCDELKQRKEAAPVNYEDLATLRNNLLEVGKWGDSAITKQSLLKKSVAIIHASQLPVPRGATPEEVQEEGNVFINSFFVEDLKRMRGALLKDSKSLSTCLQQYLGLLATPTEEDFSNRAVLQKYSTPALLAPARWPCQGDYTLALNQQLAVNLALKEKRGLLSVNGPPGTGKTTLLNDIISNVVVNRARALVALSAPEDALGEAQEVEFNYQHYKVWPLHKTLLGHEIVAASSNNSAVENISKEIPSINAVDAKWGLDYFADLAGQVTGTESWGMCAAVLGSKKNRTTFFQKFWNPGPHEGQAGLDSWLQEAQKGQLTLDWESAKEEFEAVWARHEAINPELEQLEQAIAEIRAEGQKLQDLQEEYAEQGQKAKFLARELALLRECKNGEEQDQRELRKQVEYYRALRPSWWQRLLDIVRKKSRYQVWKQHYKDTLDAFIAIQWDLQNRRKDELELQDASAQLSKAHAQLGQKIEQLQAKITQNTSHIANYRALMGANLPDEAFWQLPEEILQQCFPWHFEELHEVRAQLFVKAMQLHEAFMGQVSKQIHDNMCCVNAIMTHARWPDEYNNLLPDLWATFFMIIPVVSTTFASFAKLFQGLDKERIGYLLIDEAGQANPQAAAGALWRAKRAIIVGDPLQIEPVVTLPDAISRMLLRHCKIDSRWDVCNTSVQQLADRVNPHGTYLNRKNGKWIGLPLRVHRRCQEPMFSIANQIAYEGLMVQATPPVASSLSQEDWLQHSSWIDVRGTITGSGHWIPQEGQKVVQILDHLCQRDGQLPSLYVITPFVSIAHSMKALLKDQAQVWARQPAKSPEVVNWIKRSVGTIHTFQGKQAQRVILILGGDPRKPGAIEWVAKSPNMLNVAITRAKEFCFVIGNHHVWSKKNYFNTLADTLSIIPDGEN